MPEIDFNLNSNRLAGEPGGLIRYLIDDTNGATTQPGNRAGREFEFENEWLLIIAVIRTHSTGTSSSSAGESPS